MNAIRAFRDRAKLTQAQLAQSLGVGQSAVVAWEKGESLPRAGKLPELARILGCTIDELFESEEDRRTT